MAAWRGYLARKPAIIGYPCQIGIHPGEGIVTEQNGKFAKAGIAFGWIMAIALALAGCQPKPGYTENTIDITQGYEHKIVMSKNEAVQILGKYLSARYHSLDSYPSVSNNIRYKVFHSIDESGFTLDVSHLEIDSRSMTVLREATPGSPGVVEHSWHWEGDGSVRVMFADVNRITLVYSINSQTQKPSKRNVRLIYDNGYIGDYWGPFRTDESASDGEFSEAEILSALLVLCPNVK